MPMIEVHDPEVKEILIDIEDNRIDILWVQENMDGKEIRNGKLFFYHDVPSRQVPKYDENGEPVRDEVGEVIMKEDPLDTWKELPDPAKKNLMAIIKMAKMYVKNNVE